MDGFCVHCDHRIDLGPGAREGRRVTCPSCLAYLEVISLSPVELDWTYFDPYTDDGQTRIWSDQDDIWK